MIRPNFFVPQDLDVLEPGLAFVEDFLNLQPLTDAVVQNLVEPDSAQRVLP